ncbi:hypothetical protein V2G26_006745 [Clonostachys chloroleuca]
MATHLVLVASGPRMLSRKENQKAKPGPVAFFACISFPWPPAVLCVRNSPGSVVGRIRTYTRPSHMCGDDRIQELSQGSCVWKKAHKAHSPTHGWNTALEFASSSVYLHAPWKGLCAYLSEFLSLGGPLPCRILSLVLAAQILLTNQAF